MAGITEDRESLTGVWQGLYSYENQPGMPESHFVAVLFDGGTYLSGTIHENMNHRNGTASPANASVEGARDRDQVRFVKSYDGMSGIGHKVDYAGLISNEGNEIEGQWQIHSRQGYLFSGRFLMIRTRGPKAQATTKAFEHAG